MAGPLAHLIFHSSNVFIRTKTTSMQRYILTGNKHFPFISVSVLMLIFILFLSTCKTSKNWEVSKLEPIESLKIKQNISSKSIGEIKVSSHLGELGLPDNDKKMLEAFYSLNSDRLAWFRNNRLSRNVNQLLFNLGKAWTEGLAMEKYHIATVYETFRQLKVLSKGEPINPALYAQLDIMLTHIYFQYAADIYSGGVNPKLLGEGWDVNHEPLDFPQILHNALRRHRVKKSLEDLKPENHSYKLLSERLVRLLSIRDEGGWEVPGYFETLQAGDSSPNVFRIKKYLQKTGDLQNKDSAYINNYFYDHSLEVAVKAFQKRHGLKTDGITGTKTLEEMNRSIDYRIGQIKANLERMRWVPGDEKHYILVNIPEFMLRYYRDHKLEYEMKVVVGKKKHLTPILSDTVRYVVFNPSWNVPSSISSEEMVEKIKADSSFLKRNQFVLLKGSYLSTDTIDPDTVDWSNITAENFPYLLVQKPGSINALGRVKFLFPNHQSIYLHDTPARDLFIKYSRNFSHGCVRLDQPLELATQLLEGQISKDSITNILQSGETTSIELSEQPLIYLIYQTAWVDDNGELNFRNDIYDFDQITLRELARHYRPVIITPGSSGLLKRHH
jgi:L,D-transpeptidase YcbB